MKKHKSVSGDMPKRALFWGVTGLLTVVVLFLSCKIPFIYTVNDDLFMKNLLSGAYLGKPEAHTVYLEYPLSFVLAMLYRLQANIPWYGIIFFGFHMLSWGAVLYRLGSSKRQAGQAALWKRSFLTLPCLGTVNWGNLLLAGFLFAAIGFYHVASMQFTVTAAVLGMAAVVWFMTGELTDSVKRYLWDQSVTALFVFLSFNVRRNVLLMLVPIAGMLWLRKGVAVGKKALPSLFGMAALCVGGVAVTFVCYQLAYGDAGWKDYILYNDHATVLYDYYGWPDYGENEEFYEQLGISKEAYEGARDAYLLSMDAPIDAEAMVALAKRSEELHGQRGSVGAGLAQALSEIGKRTFSETDRPLNLVVVGMYGLIFLGVLLRRRYQALLTLGALWIGRMFSWIYVVYEGRYPMRISQSLFLVELGVLTVILCEEVLGIQEQTGVLEKAGQYVLGLSMGAFLLLLVAFSYVRLKHVFVENTWRLGESQDLEDLKDYCEQNAAYFYLVDTKSITNDTEWIFSSSGNRFEHYIVFGGWLSDSPVFEQKLALAGAADTEMAIMDGRARIIVENEERCPTDYLEKYFASRYEGAKLQAVDQFGRGGDQFIVYEVSNQYE